MNGNEIIKRLKVEGWNVKRIRGSHHMLEKEGCVVPVPVHGTADIGKGLLADIERQTGVKLK
ncbi:MAG: type II toxin-antitoxin system HicA family toxin [Sideroxyarcus sp.]|nr:type II toxin-antitoxin system HicA family toxin [Sideroxyarcus sp.]